MAAPRTRFVFDHRVCMKQVAGTLLLARVATESIHGFDRVSLDAAYELDRRGRSVAIDAHSDVGHTLALVFLGYARREFGEDAVRVVPAARAETALANRPDKGLVQ